MVQTYSHIKIYYHILGENNVKKALFLIVIFLLSSLRCYAIDISAVSAVVIEVEGGNVIYEKNSRIRSTMASTTKIMTAICAIEEGDLDKEIKIDPKAVGVEGSSIYLRNGEELTLRELVYGLMLNSGNDAAVAIACGVSGSVEKFAETMNKKAKEIGVRDTNFKNPNGLDEEGHYTTAYDLAQITAYAMKNEEFRKIASTYQTTIKGSEEGTPRYLTNHNKLLKRMEGCIGVKTGFTKKSGRCLVSASERNGVTLVAVTLNAPDDWNDHIKMMDYAFQRVERKTLLKKGECLQTLTVTKGKKNSVKVVANDEFYVFALDTARYTTRYKCVKNMEAPIKKGQKIAEVEFYMGDTLIKTVDAVAKDSVDPIKSKTFWTAFRKIAKRVICFN